MNPHNIHTKKINIYIQSIHIYIYESTYCIVYNFQYDISIYIHTLSHYATLEHIWFDITSPMGSPPIHLSQVSVRRSGRKVAPVDLAAPRKDEVRFFAEKIGQELNEQ